MAWSIVEILALFSLVLFTFLYFKSARRRSSTNLPPGPPTIPILGNLHLLGKDSHLTFTNLRQKYGDIYSFKFGSYPGIVLNGHKALKALNQMSFSGRHLETIAFKREGGIVLNENRAWIEQRRFTLQKLRDFGLGRKSAEELMLEEAKELIDRFLSNNSVGQPMNFQRSFNAAVLNTLWSMLTGQRFSHDDPKLQDLVNRLNTTIQAEGLTIVEQLSFFISWMSPLQQILEKPKQVSEFMRATMKMMHDIITEHKKTFQSDQVESDFINCYLKEIHQTTDPNSSFFGQNGVKNLPVVLFDLFIAGTETTASTLAYTFQYLAIHQDKQEKLFEEIKNIVGTDRPPSLTDRPNMPYLTSVLLEVMRYSTLLPRSLIHKTTETVQVEGFTIPKNTMVIPNLHSANHDPEVWGDPDQFRPERFIAGDGKTVAHHHESFVPFSVGKRVCLGESLARDQLFLFAGTIFQRFRIKPDPNSPPLKVEYYVTPIILSPVPKLLVLEDRLA